MNLNASEIARCLGLPLSTINRWIRQGKLPVRRSGEVFVISHSKLEKWAATRNLSVAAPMEVAKKPAEEGHENLWSVMHRGGVIQCIQAIDVATALSAAVKNVPNLSDSGRDELYQRLLEREELTSTGIGKGVAIPHPRSPLSEPIGRSMITTCFLEKPIDFLAVDDKPVFVMFILLSTSVKAHLHLLSRLAFCVRDKEFIEFLKTRPDQDALLTMTANFEGRLDDTSG